MTAIVMKENLEMQTPGDLEIIDQPVMMKIGDSYFATILLVEDRDSDFAGALLEVHDHSEQIASMRFEDTETALKFFNDQVRIV